MSYHAKLLQTGELSENLGAASGVFLSGGGIDSRDAQNIREAMYDNACPFIFNFGIFDDALNGKPDNAACVAFAGGILTRGLGGAITKLITDSRDICYLRSLATTNSNGIGTLPLVSGTIPYSIPAVLNSPGLLELESLLDHFVGPALKRIVSVYSTTNADTVSSEQRFLVIYVAVFLSAFVVFMATIYIPAINKVNKEIKQNVSCTLGFTYQCLCVCVFQSCVAFSNIPMLHFLQRMLLLLIPAVFIRAFPGLEAAVTVLLQSEDADAAGVRPSATRRVSS